MIYNEKMNTIIWTPFKNYSSSIMFYFNALETNFTSDGFEAYQQTDWKCFIANNPVSSLYPMNATRHGVAYPPINKPLDSYRRILLLRNPYERILSMWKFHTSHEQWKNDSFEHYFSRVFMFHPDTLPACRTFEGHYDEIINVENIEQGLKKFDLMTSEPFPHINKSPDNSHSLTKEQKMIIAHFHRLDFEVGGYEI